MPAKTRDLLVQECERAMSSLESCLLHLSNMKSTYADRAPKHTAFVESVGLAVITIRQQLENFRYKVM
jgi:hypothetical protein